MARRKYRFAGAKKRRNPSKPKTARRRRRRNPEAGAGGAAKKARVIRSLDERIAAAEAKLARMRSGVEREATKAAKAAARAAKRAETAARKQERAKASVARKGRRLSAAARRAKMSGVGVFGEPLTPGMARYLASLPAPAPRKGGKRRAKRGTTTRQRAARKKAAERLVRTGKVVSLAPVIYRSKSGKQMMIPSTRGLAAKALASKGSSTSRKAIASAWRAAQKAQGLATSAEDRRLLKAMGIAGVPNPSMGGTFKDLGTLMPRVGATVVSVVGIAVAGQKLGQMVEAKVTNESIKPFVVPGVSAALTVGAWALMRKNKKLAPWSSFVLAGGLVASVLHAVIRVKVGGETIGTKLGLPIQLGEYAAMAGMGEYAAMAGHTDRGIFAGLDDTDPVLSGADDVDEVSYTETLADEGVNIDDGSLNGSIFD